MELLDKLAILSDAAKYDVACTSSGVNRPAVPGKLGSASNAGCCHSFTPDGRCVTLLKVLMTNVCVYDCAYCANRRSNDLPRATFRPAELAELTIAFYRRNYIEGLFLSSGVLRDPDYTMEGLCRCLELLRYRYGFNGYIHAKAIPGCSPELLTRLGVLADRVSVNIELPSAASLARLAPQKQASGLLQPMHYLRDGIHENFQDKRLSRRRRTRFAPAGQSTQMIVGATPESDYRILTLSAALYRRLELKRVFFSAYLPVNPDPLLPDPATTLTPFRREHRLYQADWLMRFYGFKVDEIIDTEHPFLDLELDPKSSWALQHSGLFPLEINRASYDLLLRIPGIGLRSAGRIFRARKERCLDFDALRRLGVTLRRAQYFITCQGRMRSGMLYDPVFIERQLRADALSRAQHRHARVLPGQASLFGSSTWV
ncbi:MAG: putative DNA modification/repair radical SAM protein [Coriobacteriales bacterium]|jgi:putative DNA modification/repair radical SAM protein|nr:putative DNA modification/repair radical SAM protein [Coriobacteriales bacterium]